MTGKGRTTMAAMRGRAKSRREERAQQQRQLGEADVFQRELDPLLAQLDALRAENDRLGIDQRDSVEIVRELREQYAR